MHELPEQPQLILVAPGAFKHSISAAAAAEAIARGLRASPLGLPLRLFPIADGGNGTLDAFLRHGGTAIPVTVRGPLGAPVEAAFGMLPDGETAVIEMAMASGLELIDHLDARAGTTYGTGELMNAALNAGARRLIVGMGGSATTDGGAGCLQALGLRLTDHEGYDIPPGGGGLVHLATIDTSGLNTQLRDAEIIIAADVDNQAVGDAGAAAVFGPQKGAQPDDITVLDAALTHWFTLTLDATGVDVRHVPGGGAAGALAAGLMAYTGATIMSGIDLLLDYANFDAALAQAVLVITGEGRLDNQSLRGKGPVGIARRASEHNIPVIALAGSFESNAHAMRDAGIVAAWPIVEGITTLHYALQHADELLERAAYRLGCTLAIQLPRSS